MIKIDTIKHERLCQGDIITNVELIEYAEEKDGEIEISKILFPSVIVLTQDCDLLQDYSNREKLKEKPRSNQDKCLFSILVAPLYNIEHIYEGVHLSELDLQMQIISKREKKSDNKFLRNNQNPRYHYLEFASDFQLQNSVIDFKHYFTSNLRYLNKLKQSNFAGKVSELYREGISHRFASFLARIGLPDE